MRTLVTYWSNTGNTRKVARAIFDAINGDTPMCPLEEVQHPEEFDLVFLGFPVMQFGLPAPVKKFAATLRPGSRIALFITHAMLTRGGDAGQQAMLEKELDRCRAAFSGCDIAGIFHCQGELSRQTADELMNSGIPMLMEFAGMQPMTAGHPDESELAQAAEFARKMTTPRQGQ